MQKNKQGGITFIHIGRQAGIFGPRSSSTIIQSGEFFFVCFKQKAQKNWQIRRGKINNISDIDVDVDDDQDKDVERFSI